MLQKPILKLALITALFTGLLLGLTESAKIAIHEVIKSTPQATASTSTKIDREINKELSTFAKLAKELKPTVVNVSVKKRVEGFSHFEIPEPFRHFFKDIPEPPKEMMGQGSGVIISSDGYILTNNHVVSGASKIVVTLLNGTELNAKIVGTDPNTDLALLKVKPSQPLPAAKLGDSDKIAVGEWVMAIGNPFGLDETVTVGVLSGKGRVIGAGPYDDFLQTDASINPGNSGGPLFNTAGEVIGINTAIIPQAQGIGFAIPINMAKEIAEQLKTQGKVIRGFVGLHIQQLTPKLRKALKLPPDLKGALVAGLVPGGPAEKAGVQVEDIVTALNGKPIKSDRDLLHKVARTPVGSMATLTVYRHGRYLNLKLKIGQRPENLSAFTPLTKGSSDLGLGVKDITPELAHRLNTDDLDGVVVVSVRPDSPAAEAGLQKGDIIRRAGGHKIHSVRDFSSVVSKNQGGPLALLVERDGSTMFVVLDKS